MEQLLVRDVGELIDWVYYTVCFSSNLILTPGRTQKFPGYVQGLAGLFIGLGEILGTTQYWYGYGID